MLNTKQPNVKKIKQGRLQKRPEFLAVSATGKKWVSDSVIVQCLDNNECGQFRYGVTATKRVGNAVIRNRCKRRLRAAIHDIVANQQLKNADIVLIARHTTATCDWKKLTRDLQWCIKRLDLT